MKIKQEMQTIPKCPVFTPSQTEFADFQGYLEKVVKTLGSIPIFKVSPCLNCQQSFKKSGIC